MEENASTNIVPKQHYGFKKGNPGGPGNPLAGKIAKLRASIVDAVTPEDFKKIAKKLLALALTGDVQAIKELMNRTIGKEKQILEIEAPIKLYNISQETEDAV